MTKRSVIVGLLVAAFIASYTYFNDHIMRQSFFVGNYMPHSVYGMLIFFVLAANPLLARFKKSWALTGRELAVVLALAVAACSIPGSGLMRWFTNAVMLPQHKEKVRPGWKAEEVIRMVPEHMLAGSSSEFRADDFTDPRRLAEELSQTTVADSRLLLVHKRIRAAIDDVHYSPMAEAARRAAEVELPAKVAAAKAEAMRATLEEAEAAEAKALAQAAAAAQEAEEATENTAAEDAAYAVELAAQAEAATRSATAAAEKAAEAEAESAEAAAELRARLDDCCQVLVPALNGARESRDIYSPAALETVSLPEAATRILKRARPPGEEDEEGLPLSIALLEMRDVRNLNRHLIDTVYPDDIYAHAKRRDDEVSGFLFGSSKRSEAAPLSSIPWSAWVRPFLFWIPLFLIMIGGVLGLAVMVHKQWAKHEALTYPIAKFVDALLPSKEGGMSKIIRNRLFLGTAAIVLAIRLLNYADEAFEGSLVSIPMQVDFTSLTEIFPLLDTGVAKWGLFTARLYFAVVGLAFFLATDVSISLALATPLGFLIAAILPLYGVTLAGKGGLYGGGVGQLFHTGAYIGLLVMFVYTGRHYYWNVMRKAVFRSGSTEVDDNAVWGARVFLMCATAFMLYLIAAGIDWPLASLYTILLFGIWLALGRLLAETGLFFMDPRIYPCATLVALFGIEAVGPSTAILMYMVSTIMIVKPREALMPFMVNALKVADERECKVGRVTLWAGAAVVLALFIAVPVTLKYQHGAGTSKWDGWGAGAVPRYPFYKTVSIKQRLRAQDRLQDAEQVSGFARFSRITPDTGPTIAFVIGIALVVGLTTARLRWTWWPIHPIILIGMWNYPVTMFWVSFFVGAMIKILATKYGGHSAYRRIAPAMFGLVAGDMLGMIIPALIGTLYYLATGDRLPSYVVMPD